MKKSMRKRRGFTLVEVLVVVVILGLLAALVVPRVVGRGEEAKRTAASVQIREIEQALEMYRLDSSMYPTTALGIEGLVVKPSIPPEPRKYREGGYLPETPSDRGKSALCTGSPETMANMISSRQVRTVGRAATGPGKILPTGSRNISGKQENRAAGRRSLFF